MELVDTSTENGLRIYRRSLTFILIKACRDLYPERKLMIKHTLGNGLYCEFLNQTCTDAEIEKIEKRMRQMVEDDIPISRRLVPKTQACQMFAGQNENDTLKLLQYRDKVNVHVYELDGYYEYFYGYMVSHTGILDKFRLINHPPGIVVQVPEKDDQNVMQPYKVRPKLFQVYQEAKAWADMLQTPHLAALNEIIARGDYNDIIRVNEALHEKKVAQIADMICRNSAARVVLIAGPSSSGKTTFAQRLLIQLRVNGKKPVSISLDNYFVDKELTPRDEDGDYDFEAIEALKLELFNEHLSSLIKGEQVEVPIYNFKTGTCEPRGIPLRVPVGEPIIIEGIHGLNDRLTWSIPAEQNSASISESLPN
jgi:uridine kinase